MMMIVVAVYAVVLGVMVVRLYNALCVYRARVKRFAVRLTMTGRIVPPFNLQE